MNSENNSNHSISNYCSRDIEITGLNNLLRQNGFVLPPGERTVNDLNGLVVLLKGKPGTGKSTLSLQLAYNLVKNTSDIIELKDRKAKFYSLEQKTEDIAIKYASIIIHKIITDEICIKYEDYNFSTTNIKNQDIDNNNNVLSEIEKEFLEQYKRQISKCLIDKSQCSFGEGNFCEELKSTVKEKYFTSSLKNHEDNFNQLIDNIDHQIKDQLSNFSQIDFHKSASLKQNQENPFIHINSPIFKIINIANSLNDTNEIMPLVVIDGLNILTADNIRKINLHQIINSLRKRALYTFIAYEPSNKDDYYLEYLVDMVINLRQNTIHEPITYWLNELCISKSRYQNAVLGWHQYKIRDYGLEVFPSTHFQVHHANNMMQQLNESKIHVRKKENDDDDNKRIKPSILEKIIKIKSGSFTVILGARATFKTTFTLDFLFSGAKIEQYGLLLSLIDNRESIIKNLEKCPRDINNCSKECFKKLYHFQQRPGCITPSEFLHFLNERIEYSESVKKKPIKRVIFWDLTQIEFRFPLFANDPMFLPTLMDYFSKKGISAVVMGSGNAQLTRAAAAMADNVLFCWRDTLDCNKIELHISKNNTMKNDIIPISFYKKDDETYDEYIALYVDRCAEKLGNEGKILHAFPLNKNKDIVIPNCSDDYSADIMKNFAVENEFIFKNAEEKINNIVRMQGIGDVK